MSVIRILSVVCGLDAGVEISMGRLVILITVFCVFAAVTFWSVLYVAKPLMSAQTANQTVFGPVMRTSAPLP